MYDELRQKVRSIAENISRQDPSRIREANTYALEQAADEFRRFKEGFDSGNCYLCGRPLATFSEKNICLHWLLKPKGFKKKHFHSLGLTYGFFRMQSYLRWVANQEGFAKNINDMQDEAADNRISKVTICYRHLEWSFSCSQNDYLGHTSTQHSRHQHFHFQMRVGGKQFINYSDFHVPFSEEDIIKIESIRTFPKAFTHEFPFGWGMEDALSEEMLPEIINSATLRADDDDPSVFSISSFVQAEEGQLISGDDIADLIEEAKTKKVPLSSLLHKLPNARAQIIVSPKWKIKSTKRKTIQLVVEHHNQYKWVKYLVILEVEKKFPLLKKENIVPKYQRQEKQKIEQEERKKVETTSQTGTRTSPSTSIRAMITR